MSGWIAGATIGSSLLGASASRSAAKTQAAAADRAAELQRQTAQEQLALQKRVYEEGVTRQEPWRQVGQISLNQLATLLGVAPPPPPPPSVSSGGGWLGDVMRQASSAIGGSQAQYGGDTTSPEFGKYAKAFSETDWTADPSYAFRMSEGLKALDRQAAARGGLISGGALKAAQRYGQELGSQEYQNAFNRYQAERQARLGSLQSLAGVGQTTAQQMGAAGQQYAGQAGQTAMGMAGAVGQAGAEAAQARASGYMGAANAITGGLGQYLNYQQQQAQNALLQQALGQRQQGYEDPYSFFSRG